MTQEEYDKRRYDIVAAFIANLDESEKIDLWNEYCSENKSMEDRIELNEDYIWNAFYKDKTPWELAVEFEGTDLRTSAAYVTFSIFGPKTYDYIDDEKSPYCEDDILRYNVDDLIDLLNSARIDTDEMDDELNTLDEEKEAEDEECEDE